MAVSLDHNYSQSVSQSHCYDTGSTNRNAKRKVYQCLSDSSILPSNPVAPVCPLVCTENISQPPLALLFPDCVMCLWSANAYSYAVVADFHRRVVEYAGDHRPHVAVYSACVDDWFEFHKVAEIAPHLTKEDCVAHFTTNLLCRFNRQRCQPALLYHRKMVPQYVDLFPSTATLFVKDQQECDESKPNIHWCFSAFLCFIVVQITKLFHLKLPEKKGRALSAVLQRHTDFFISQWMRG